MIRRPPRTTRTATLLPYTTLFRSRWPEGFRCPRCAGTVHCVLRDGTRKVFQCSACRHQASLIAGTLLQRSEEHTSELQSLMRISYAVFCLKKKKKHTVHEKNRLKTQQK